MKLGLDKAMPSLFIVANGFGKTPGTSRGVAAGSAMMKQALRLALLRDVAVTNCADRWVVRLLGARGLAGPPGEGARGPKACRKTADRLDMYSTPVSRRAVDPLLCRPNCCRSALAEYRRGLNLARLPAARPPMIFHCVLSAGWAD